MCWIFFLVNLSVFDVWVLAAAGGGGALKKFAVLRVLRLLRMLRIVRLLRVFRELFLILKGITDSVRPVFWASLLMLIILYVCAIFTTQVIGGSDAYPGYAKDFLDGFNSYQAYGTIGRSMWSLYTLALGDDLRNHIQPVVDRQPHMIIFYVFFILFSTFGVMNVIVGVIVDNTMSAATAMDSQAEDRSRSLKIREVSAMIHWVASIDVDGSNTVQVAELEPLLHGKLSKVVDGVPFLLDPPELFDLLDVRAVGKITDEDFVSVIFRLSQNGMRQSFLTALMGINRVNRLVRELASDIRDVKHISQDEFREQAPAAPSLDRTTPQEHFRQVMTAGGPASRDAPALAEPKPVRLEAEVHSAVGVTTGRELLTLSARLRDQERSVKQDLLQKLDEFAAETSKQRPLDAATCALREMEARVVEKISALAPPPQRSPDSPRGRHRSTPGSSREQRQESPAWLKDAKARTPDPVLSARAIPLSSPR
mmetsp:Transcript_30483/g.78840  ORF Transcript_30483/g.78840 Transcript_30483/m.78840 type:complete len:481 (-) Transcript_30483:106-1548(-)